MLPKPCIRIFALCNYLIMADAGPPNPATGVPTSATHAARLADRDVLPSSLCGFWINNDGQNLITEFTTETWSWWCTIGPCAIDTFVTPNLVFCPSQSALYTSYYAYGSWPVGGCGTGETCWCFTWKPLSSMRQAANPRLNLSPSSNPKVHRGSFDNGASLDCACVPTTFPDTRAVTTQVGSLSIKLLKYTPPNTPSSTTPTSTSRIITSNINESGTNAGSSSLTTTSASSSTTSQHASLPTSSDLPTSPGSDGLSIGAEVGSILGAIFGFIFGVTGLVVAIHYGRKTLRQRNVIQAHDNSFS